MLIRIYTTPDVYLSDHLPLLAEVILFLSLRPFCSKSLFLGWLLGFISLSLRRISEPSHVEKFVVIARNMTKEEKAKLR